MTPSNLDKDTISLDDVPQDRRPRHIAVIMDGNGRWAADRDLPRSAGHRAGARAVREVVTAAARWGVEALTLYSFSSENWKRPAEEVDALMQLYTEYLLKERQELIDNNVRFMQIGRRGELPKSVLDGVDEMIAATHHCTGLKLVLALNYGSRTEITDAVRTIAEHVRDGALDPADICESTVSSHLYTAGLPDPDLLVRTAGEMRLSNYLLWQISYAELCVLDVFWPDFRQTHLADAIRRFAQRDRRFGDVARS